MITRNSVALALVLACLAGSAMAARAQDAPDARGDAPPWMLGAFADDYDAHYTITPELWLHGSHAGYHIVEWNVEERYLVARNDGANPTEPGRWSRIDWVELDGTDGWGWGYCYAVYDAGTPEAAEQGPESRRESPRDGCNGFPFSRMRRVEGPGVAGSPRGFVKRGTFATLRGVRPGAAWPRFRRFASPTHAPPALETRRWLASS